VQQSVTQNVREKRNAGRQCTQAGAGRSRVQRENAEICAVAWCKRKRENENEYRETQEKTQAEIPVNAVVSSREAKF